VIEIDNEKALGWLRNGAQPTERVEKLLKISGAWDEFKGQPSTPKAEEASVEEDSVEEDSVEEASVEEAEAEATEGDEEQS
jgi:small subunit ribosomal protein S16